MKRVATDREDLTAAIVDSLKASPRSRHDVDLIVRWKIDELRSLLQNAKAGEPSFGESAVNKRYGREVEDLARKLLQKLDGMPSGTHQALMAPAPMPAYQRQSTLKIWIGK